MNEQAIDIVIRAKDEATKAIGKIKGSVDSLNGGLQTMGNVAKKATIALSASLAGVVAFGVKSAVSIEQTRVAFENLYGSVDKAKKHMKDLSDFAKKTPFEFPELSDASMKLQNVAGVAEKDVIPMLTNLGDIASSQGKQVGQAVEAYNDAITGEYERLKEFGIKASKSGDDVTFSFKGQEKTVKATKEEIGKYLQEVGKMDGIAGSMDKQSQTLGGRLSTLKDQFKSLSMAVIGVSDTGEIQAGGLFERLSQAVATLGTFLENNSAKITAALQSIMQIFSFAFDFIGNIITNFFTGGTGDWIQFFNIVKLTIQQGLSIIQQFWNKYGEDIKLVINTAFTAIKGVIANFFTYIIPIIKTGLGIVGEIFKFFASILRGDFSSAFDSLKNILKLVLVQIKNIVILGLNLILGIFGTNMTELRKSISLKWAQIKEDVSKSLSEMANNAKEWAGNMIQMFIDGMKEKVQALKDGIIQIATTIQDYLGFHSPTKKGPGSEAHKWMPNLINMLAIGLEEGKTQIEGKANIIATALKSIGQKFSAKEISETLLKISDKAREGFSSVTQNIETSVEKIKTLKGELDGINETIKNLSQQRGGTEKEGKLALASRAIQIEKDIAAIKADAEVASTAEGQEKIKKLESELEYANIFLTTQEKALALQQMNRSESQVILDNMWEKMGQLDIEIMNQKKLAEDKKKAIADEKVLHKDLIDSKTALDKAYFLLFNNHIEGVKSGLRETIAMMQQLASMSGGGISTGIAGARATGGTMMSNQPYLVGERGPELVIPKSSSTVIPNSQTGSSQNISINFGGVSVRNDGDILKIAKTVEDSITRKMQLYRQGIA